MFLQLWEDLKEPRRVYPEWNSCHLSTSKKPILTSMPCQDSIRSGRLHVSRFQVTGRLLSTKDARGDTSHYPAAHDPCTGKKQPFNASRTIHEPASAYLIWRVAVGLFEGIS